MLRYFKNKLSRVIEFTSGYATWFTAWVQSASLYDNFGKPGNYVIDDVIIWVKIEIAKNSLREL